MGHVKLVVLAFPDSLILGNKLFFEKGAHHVISFDKVASEKDSYNLEGQMDEFFDIFYEYLFNTNELLTVTEAFHQTLMKFNDNVELKKIVHLTRRHNPDSPITLIFEKTPLLIKNQFNQIDSNNIVQFQRTSHNVQMKY